MPIKLPGRVAGRPCAPGLDKSAGAAATPSRATPPVAEKLPLAQRTAVPARASSMARRGAPPVAKPAADVGQARADRLAAQLKAGVVELAGLGKVALNNRYRDACAPALSKMMDEGLAGLSALRKMPPAGGAHGVRGS